MVKTFNFTISAVVALSIYLLLILLVILYLQKPTIKKYQAKNTNTVIELEIISKDIQKTPKKIKKEPKQINIIKKDIKINKSSSVSATKKTNLKSLFAKVSTKSSKIKEKNVLNIKNNKVSSRFKSKLNEEKNRSDLKIKDIVVAKKDKKLSVAKNQDNFDEYYSNLSSIILTRWYKYPLFSKDNYLVKVQITINPKGLFSYNIISYSGNLNIDNAIKDFLSAQINEIYPQTDDKKTKNILINFINDKE